MISSGNTTPIGSIWQYFSLNLNFSLIESRIQRILDLHEPWNIEENRKKYNRNRVSPNIASYQIDICIKREANADETVQTSADREPDTIIYLFHINKFTVKGNVCIYNISNQEL